MQASGKKVRIGEVLVQEGILSQEQLDRALVEQKKAGQILGEMLVEKGLVTSEEMIAVLAKRLGLMKRLPLGESLERNIAGELVERGFIRRAIGNIGALIAAEIDRLQRL